MRTDSLQQFVTLRRQLTEERATLQSRLAQINEALGEMSLPSLAPIQAAPDSSPSQAARTGRRAAGGGSSLREQVIAVLQEGPKTKEEVLAAVQKRGYKFSTTNPLNSLGVILYGKNPKLNRVDGRFSLKGRAASAPGGQRAATTSGKRQISAAGRARIAEAQRKRWAATRNGKGPDAPTVKSDLNGTAPKRKMSPAARKAIAEAARKRWAAAKAAGKSRL